MDVGDRRRYFTILALVVGISALATFVLAGQVHASAPAIGGTLGSISLGLFVAQAAWYLLFAHIELGVWAILTRRLSDRPRAISTAAMTATVGATLVASLVVVFILGAALTDNPQGEFFSEGVVAWGSLLTLAALGSAFVIIPSVLITSIGLALFFVVRGRRELGTVT